MVYRSLPLAEASCLSRCRGCDRSCKYSPLPL
jgi:hypothetical protein